MTAEQDPLANPALERLLYDLRSVPDRPVGAHLSREQMKSFAREAVDEREASSILSHIASCASCAAEVDRRMDRSAAARPVVEFCAAVSASGRGLYERAREGVESWAVDPRDVWSLHVPAAGLSRSAYGPAGCESPGLLAAPLRFEDDALLLWIAWEAGDFSVSLLWVRGEDWARPVVGRPVTLERENELVGTFATTREGLARYVGLPPDEYTLTLGGERPASIELVFDHDRGD